MKRFISILIIFSLFISCTVEKNSKTVENRNSVIGDASPVYLKFGAENTIYLDDYFSSHSEVDSVVLPGELSFSWKKGDDKVSIKGNLNNAYSNLSVYVGSQRYDIVLKSLIKEAYTFKFDPGSKKYKDLKIKGTFNNWDTEKNKLEFRDGLYTTDIYLMPGIYQYVLVDGDNEFPDPSMEEKVNNGVGGYNTVLRFGEQNINAPFARAVLNDGKINLTSEQQISYLAYFDNKLIDQGMVLAGEKNEIDLPEVAGDKRNSLRIYTYSGKSQGNDILIPLKGNSPVTDVKDLSRRDFHSQIMYEVMVDRFFNGNSSNDKPLNVDEVKKIADYMGGDLKGVTQKIEEGFFKELGINTIWLTPIVQNPRDAWGEWNAGGVYSKFAGYHGYWPLEITKIDSRFGTPEELDELLDVAHKNNMNVILDYVANHVHQDAPVIVENPSWKTELMLPDGTQNIAKWDSERLTTWFDWFLPTLDLENQQVTEVMTDTAMFWLNRYEFDGLRHDACKHIPLNFWRTLTSKIKKQVVLGKERPVYQVGETYSGPELIGSYVNSGMLNGQFDFNLYDQSVRSFLIEDESLSMLKIKLEESLMYYGYHHLMGNISGNHDRARVISYADGSVSFDEDTKLAGWTRKISNRDKSASYDKVGQIIAFSAVIPGVPVIYYGDEIGMPGGNDPDNRRMMEFENLPDEKLDLKNKTSKLLKFRASNPVLMYGDTKVLESSENSLVLLRNYLGKNVIAVFSKGNSGKVEFELPSFVGSELNALFGNTVQVKNGIAAISIKDGGYEILY